MPQYKRKKHSRINTKKIKNDIKNNKTFEFKEKQTDDFKKNVKVINTKSRKKFKYKVLGSLIAVVLAIYLISLIIFPIGILETFSDFCGSFGSGEYPVSLSGSKVLNVIQNSNYFYVLSDTNIYKITNSGKFVSTINHGCSAPVLKTAKTRCLIYDQGQKTYNIYKLKENVLSKKTDFSILCADISDSGTYAVATLSDSYSSTVSVYDKSGKPVFSWNCAKEMIHSVSLSPNGKKIAIISVGGKSGELNSTLHIFNIKNTDSENTLDYGSKTIYSSYANSKGLFIIHNSGFDFIKWSNGAKNEINTAFDIDIFKLSKYGAVFVLNSKSNKTDNTVKFVSKNCKKSYEFTFNGIISDISIKNSHIFVISEGKIFIYDIKGNLVSSSACGFDYKYIIPTGSRNVNIISDNNINYEHIK